MSAPFFERGGSVLHVGDCREVMASLPECSVDAVVCDPPYELGFMGKGWDSTGIAFQATTWATALRVLKPGGYLLAFGGSRTFHRIACAIEDAGFELRDTLSWLYGTGFPKSLNLGDGRGTALKPAWEPITLARKPLVGTVAANVQAHGTGALSIDGCRIDAPEISRKSVSPNAQARYNGIFNRGNISTAEPRTTSAGPEGRWPANLVLDEEAAAALDAQTGTLTSHNGGASRGVGFNGGSNSVRAHKKGSDSGGASRFFYVAKASRAERDAGCESLPARTGGEATDREDGSAGLSNPRAGAGRTGGARNVHPTVKPVELMRWLVRLVTPPGGTVLDPFTGSGSTGVATLLEGFAFVGVEQSQEYAEIAAARIGAAIDAGRGAETQGDLFGAGGVK